MAGPSSRAGSVSGREINLPKLDIAKGRTGETANRRTRDVPPSLRCPVSPIPRRGGGDPRALALDVLQRVEATDAYANLLLDARLRRGGLRGPDRALATELVYGVLRWRGKLDWILARVLDRPLSVLDQPVRQILRLGVYQLCCLTRIPTSPPWTSRYALRAGREPGGAQGTSTPSCELWPGNAPSRAAIRSGIRSGTGRAWAPIRGGWWSGGWPGWARTRPGS